MHFNIYTQLSQKHWTCALSSELKAIRATHQWAVILHDNTGQFFHNLNPDNVQNSFLKVSFSQIFYHLMSQINLFVFSHPETNNCRTKLLSFFLNKNISILYTLSSLKTHIYLLYTLKCFPHHLYTSQVLTLENLNKTKKQVIEML